MRFGEAGVVTGLKTPNERMAQGSGGMRECPRWRSVRDVVTCKCSLTDNLPSSENSEPDVTRDGYSLYVSVQYVVKRQ